MAIIKILPHPEYCPAGAELNVPAGTSICEALLDNKINIEHACDMSCACTTCHVIVRDGFNVFPRDVEDALLEHAAVAAAGVVGRPDDRHGEEVVAVVALRAGAEASADELVSFAKARLGAHRYPREVRLVRSLPLTPVGKVDRKLLRAEL